MILSGAVSACGAINLSPEIDLLGDLTAHKAECASKLPTTAYSPEYFSPVVKEGMFGNLGQKPYLEAAGSAIDLVAQKILKKGIKTDFHGLLADLSKIRKEIALRTNTPMAERFGVRRNEMHAPFSYPFLILSGQYILAGLKICENVFPLLAQAALKETSEEDIFTKPFQMTCQDSPFSSFTLELLSQEAIKARGLNTVRWGRGLKGYAADAIVNPYVYSGFCEGGEESYQLFLRNTRHHLSGEAMLLSLTKKISLKDSWNAIVEREKEKDRELLAAKFKDFKQQKHLVEGDGYHGIKLAKAFHNLEEEFSQPINEGEELPPKTHYLLFSMRHEVLGKLYATSKFVTWLNRTPGEDLDDTLDRAYENSRWLVMHQDIFLLEDTLKECERLFRDVLSWDHSKGTLELIEKMAPLIYLLTHSHRDSRGTAAMNEWLERGIYKSFGFDMLALSTRMIDLDAFCNTYPVYFEIYKKSFSLVPIGS
jgi:hypothetical protein